MEYILHKNLDQLSQFPGNRKLLIEPVNSCREICKSCKIYVNIEEVKSNGKLNQTKPIEKRIKNWFNYGSWIFEGLTAIEKKND